MEASKECVTTHLPNQCARKMDRAAARVLHSTVPWAGRTWWCSRRSFCVCRGRASTSPDLDWSSYYSDYRTLKRRRIPQPLKQTAGDSDLSARRQPSKRRKGSRLTSLQACSEPATDGAATRPSTYEVGSSHQLNEYARAEELSSRITSPLSIQWFAHCSLG